MSVSASAAMTQPEPGRGRTSVPPPLSQQTSSSTTPTITNGNGTTTNTGKKHHNPKLKAHSRSQSHNKLVGTLSTSQGGPKHASRPHLNRSKSSDVLMKSRSANLKRSNRSMTKMSGLQPLTKTVSNQSIKSNKSTGSLKGLGNSSTHLAPLSGLKTTGRKGKAILRLNDDDINNEEYEDIENAGDKEVNVQESRTNSRGSNRSGHNRGSNNNSSSNLQGNYKSNNDNANFVVANNSHFIESINNNINENAATLIEQINNVPDTLAIAPEEDSESDVARPELDDKDSSNEQNNDNSIEVENIEHAESASEQSESISGDDDSEPHNDQNDRSRRDASRNHHHLTHHEYSINAVSRSESSNPSSGDERELSNKRGNVHLRRNLTDSARSSTDDLAMANNLYGGSLLLSQSTGLTKKIDSKNANHHLHQKLIGADGYTTGNTTNNSSNSAFTNNNTANGTTIPLRPIVPIEPNNHESISGISFHANHLDAPNNGLAEPVTTNRNVSQNNSYQSNQTIFNNLQRTNNQYMKKLPNNLQMSQAQVPATATSNQYNTQQQQTTSTQVGAGINNFSNFLANNNSTSSSAESHNAHNIETRTQQRLWLQRENSLMDVTNLDPNKISNFSNLSLNNLMFAHHYNGNQSQVNMHNYNNNQSQVNMRELYQQQQLPLAATGGPHASLQNNASGNNGPGSSVSTIHGQLSNSHLNGVLDNQSVGSSNNTNINGLLLMAQNSHQNSIQSRTEFERLNREYLNVRRHLNPVGESLSRLEKIFASNELKVVKSRKNFNGSSSSLAVNANNSTNSSNSNSFKEFSPSYQEKEQEVSSTLNRLWQDAIISSSSAAANSARGGGYSVHQQQQQQHHLHLQQQQQQQQQQQHLLQSQAANMQRPVNPRISSYNQNQNAFGNMRAPQTPTTRAVKLAGQVAPSQSSIPSSQIRRGSEQSVNNN
ncbi:uncharacterized protein RJT20DRAFT_131508 [Scheffersomyces xylosifermentans]|uniref:uncharacterized protein n=1 Tax=Scheffersomyces xylosifermentans TaxID=1304137 RepID=UPI00315D55A7